LLAATADEHGGLVRRVLPARCVRLYQSLT